MFLCAPAAASVGFIFTVRVLYYARPLLAYIIIIFIVVVIIRAARFKVFLLLACTLSHRVSRSLIYETRTSRVTKPKSKSVVM